MDDWWHPFIEKRKRMAKERNIYLDGQLVPTKKVRKEISRQGYMTVSQQFRQAQGEYLKASRLYPINQSR